MAILYGTQSNGETLPVLVDQFGNLLAKGIDGAQGPPGPIGPPGVGELPPGAFDGAVLGWENGELVWFGTPIPPVVIKGFRPVIYTGNGGNQLISCGFSPDLVWIKQRFDDTEHSIYDIIRGPQKEIFSNSNAQENTISIGLTSFDADGFTVGSSSRINRNTAGYIAWCWNAGDTTVTNNDGSIPSQVRSNGTFSVVKYNGFNGGGTVGHGLSNAPSLIFAKSLTNDISWGVYTKITGKNNYLLLNQPNAVNDQPNKWGTSEPSSTVFGIDPAPPSSNNADNMVAYCWAQTPGETDFGQYDGGSRQTIQTGFRPSFVMIKSKEVGDWFMFDNARGAGKALYANLVDTEQVTGAVEFLDNGFQLLFALPGLNESNVSYIYAAFANTEDAAYAQRQLRRQARQEKRQQNETPLR